MINANDYIKSESLHILLGDQDRLQLLTLKDKTMPEMKSFVGPGILPYTSY